VNSGPSVWQASTYTRGKCIARSRPAAVIVSSSCGLLMPTLFDHAGGGPGGGASAARASSSSRVVSSCRTASRGVTAITLLPWLCVTSR